MRVSVLGGPVPRREHAKQKSNRRLLVLTAIRSLGHSRPGCDSSAPPEKEDSVYLQASALGICAGTGGTGKTAVVLPQIGGVVTES